MRSVIASESAGAMPMAEQTNSREDELLLSTARSKEDVNFGKVQDDKCCSGAPGEPPSGVAVQKMRREAVPSG